MKTLNLIQGDANWHAHRAASKNASDAPAMLGCSEYKTRSELLHEAFTGIRPEATPDLQRRYDDGHAIEEAQLPGAEGVIGEQLYPVVGCERFGDIELSASFDGLTLLEDTAYECKTLNDKLRAALPAPGPDGNDAAALPKMYRVQMEQQLMVCGGDRVLFTAATKDGSDVRRCWYSSDPALRAEILAGWKQFDADLKNYVPPTAAAPAPTGRAPESLPALLVQVTGAVTASNLAEFKEIALSAIRSVNRELTTDQHFADAAKAVKWCSDVEERIDAAKEHALSQTASIDALFKVMDDIKAEARQTRLDLEKLVKARNVSLKTEIVTAAQQALAKHIAALNERLGRPYMPPVPADFAGAIYGKKSFDSMRAALDATLANAKIAANEVADKIDTNLKYLREHAEDYKALFADAATIVLKAPDDLQALAKSRIADHKAEIERQAEAQRERIRKEEQERADREAQERVAAEQRQREEAEAQERRQRETAQAPAAPQAQPIAALEPVRSVASVPPASTANVVPLSRPAAPQADTGARVKLGDICASIAPLSITADGLAALGFKQEPSTGAAKLYKLTDLPAIYAAMVAHIEAVQAKQAA